MNRFYSKKIQLPVIYQSIARQLILFSMISSTSSIIRDFSTISPSASTLLIASTTDMASMNIVNNLLTQDRWENLINDLDPSDNEGYYMKTNTNNNIFLWVQKEPLLRLDNAHQIFTQRYLELISDNTKFINDAIFLSKHCAASGTVSLTVHPIGI